METKLTLRLEEKVIKRAKVYARKHKISLSKMIESYLDSLTSDITGTEPDVTPLVDSLSGVIDLPEEFDYREAYREHIRDKHQ